ncbi:MAG: cell envelope integrity protein CreD [Pelagimonas sp.]|jgi:inner membrane protein|nr:cell envelope integrity protein CreD [Pelagimonas sp.]
MLKSAGWRFAIVGLLTLFMFIPLFFAAEVIDGRKRYSQSTIQTVGAEWGGAQRLSGPVMVIPVERHYTVTVRKTKRDPESGAVLRDPVSDVPLQENVQEPRVDRVNPVYLFPERFDVTIATQTEIRRRGIFRAPVYQASTTAQFDFDLDLVNQVIDQEHKLLWDETEIRIRVSSNRALRGQAEILADGESLMAEPFTEDAGFWVATGDPRGTKLYDLSLGFNGAQELFIAPVGRTSQITMTSDWPHPSFAGGFLPNEHEVSDAGFRAHWTIPHLARSLPHVAREDSSGRARSNEMSFGVRLIEPNDFYQKAYRAARYGILFIALTFLTILLTEKVGARATDQRPAHPVQYILVGLAQTVFVLLMVAYAEHLGFEVSYLISAGAVIGLLTFFGVVALKLGRRVWVLSTALVIVYAVLYLILKSADYALLAGSTLAFFALAVTMIATRNEDWYGPARPPKAKAVKPDAPPVAGSDLGAG